MKTGCIEISDAENFMVAQLSKKYVFARPSKLIQRLMSYLLFEGRPLTTRGRWINPLLFLMFAVEARIPQVRKVRKPIFILGTGRNGSTILGLILSMHNEIGYLNEAKALWHAIADGGDVIGNFGERGGRFILREPDAIPQVRRRARRLFGIYLLLSGSNRVLDKSGELVFRTKFVKHIFPDAKFIFLIRNGYDFCYSVERWSKENELRHSDLHDDWWGRNQRKWKQIVSELIPEHDTLSPLRTIAPRLNTQVDMAAVEWMVTARWGKRLLEENKDCLMMVRYEDLIRNPAKTLASICEFTELPNDQVMMSFAENVLYKTSVSKTVRLNCSLQPLFQEVMKDIGYI